MQAGFMAFQGRAEDILSPAEKQNRNTGGTTTAKPMEAVVPQASRFLATLRQIIKDPAGSGRVSGLEAGNPSRITLNPAIQIWPEDASAALNCLIHFALQAQKPASGQTATGAVSGSMTDLLGHLQHSDATALQSNTGRQPDENKYPTTGSDREGLLSRLRELTNDFIRMNQEVQISDPPTDEQASRSADQWDKKNQLFRRVSGLASLNGANTTKPVMVNSIEPLLRFIAGLAPTSSESNGQTGSIEPASENAAANTENGSLDQFRSEKFLSYFSSKQNGFPGEPPIPGDKLKGQPPVKAFTVDGAKRDAGSQIADASTKIVISERGDGNIPSDPPSRSRAVFLQGGQLHATADIPQSAKHVSVSPLDASASHSSRKNNNPHVSARADAHLQNRGAHSNGHLNDQTVKVAKDSPVLGGSAAKPHGLERATHEDTVGDAFKRDLAKEDTLGLLSGNRISAKISEPEGLSKDAPGTSNASRTGAFNQIIEKAVLNLKNGNSEVKIDLKPDFLGQVRMRISTENNLVTLKILTEFHGVKDIIENNIHQLKADLQNHGLEIDRLDVSVAKDSPHHGGGRHMASPSHARSNGLGRKERESPADGESTDTCPLSGKRGNDNAIDFFV